MARAAVHGTASDTVAATKPTHGLSGSPLWMGCGRQRATSDVVDADHAALGAADGAPHKRATAGLAGAHVAAQREHRVAAVGEAHHAGPRLHAVVGGRLRRPRAGLPGPAAGGGSGGCVCGPLALAVPAKRVPHPPSFPRPPRDLF